MAFVHLLLRILLSKELGVFGIGLYTLVFTIYLFGNQFANFGLGTALTKYIPEHLTNGSKINEFISVSIVGSFFSGLMIGILLYISSNFIANNFFHSPEMTYLLKITSVSFPFIALQKTNLGILNGMQKMHLFAFLNIFHTVCILLFSYIFVVLFSLGVQGAVFGIVIPTIISGILSVVLILGFFEFKTRLFYNIFIELSRFGLYVVLANSMGIINTQADSLLIGYFMDETEVGYYAIAIILIQCIILLPNAIERVTYPITAAYFGQNDYQNIIKLVKSTILKTFIITAFFSMILAVFGRLIITVFFTEEFLPAYIPLLILLVGYAIYAPIVSVGGTLAGIGKIDVVFKITGLAALINILFNLILIPKYGILGAAIATSLSLIFMSTTVFYILRRFLKIMSKDHLNKSN